MRRNLSLALAVIGLINATYLTAEHYRHAIVPCSLAHGCETVLTSQYATFLGLPVSLYGCLFFGAAVALLLSNAKRWILQLLAASGLAVSALLFYLMSAQIRAYCQYCLLNDLVILAFFISVFWPIRKPNQEVRT
jgi:uncharacterized membrane protein